MVKKNAARISAVVLAMAMMSPAAMTSAHAAVTYQPVKGTETTFDKYMVEKKQASVPNATFTFTIKPGTAAAAVPGKSMEVLDPSAAVNGHQNATGTPVILGESASADEKTLATAADATAENQVKAAYVTFAPTDATTLESAKPEGKTIDFATKATDDEKYATKTLTVDFSNVKFTRPGVYRWEVKETASTQQAITSDDATKYLDVYVTDDSGKLAVSSYVLHDNAAAPSVNATEGTSDVAKNNDKVADKTTGFTNKLATQDLSVAKMVEGNQGSKDKYFKFHVQVGKDKGKTVQDADRFQVAISETAPISNDSSTMSNYTDTAMKAANGFNAADANAKDASANGIYITGKQLTGGYDFYLKSDQYLTIKGLPKDAAYTLTEVKEDYAETDSIAKKGADLKAAFADPIAFDDAHQGSIGTEDLYAGFTNTKNGVIPTGIVNNHPVAFGSLAAMVCAAFAAMFLFKKNKKDERPTA